jgi:predicted nucleic acid-binding protein
VNYLLDTCVISELVKPAADEKVTSWISNGLEETIHLSVITIGEIQKGITKLPASAKKHQLQNWLDNDLALRFENRIVPIDQKVARMWGQILAQAEEKGRQIPAIDGLIAATGLVYDMTVVTRNVSDMQVNGLSLFNPWEAA